VKVHQTI